MYSLGDIIKNVRTGQVGRVTNMNIDSVIVQIAFMRFERFETSETELLLPAFLLEEVTKKIDDTRLDLESDISTLQEKVQELEEKVEKLIGESEE